MPTVRIGFSQTSDLRQRLLLVEKQQHLYQALVEHVDAALAVPVVAGVRVSVNRRVYFE